MTYDMSELGTDIGSDWTLNSTGDLVLVSDDDNLVQAIRNRLNAWREGFEVFYDNYGGTLEANFGLRKVESSLEFIKLEVENILNQEPRLNDFTVDCYYDENMEVHVDVSVHFTEDDTFELNLVLNDDGMMEVEENA